MDITSIKVPNGNNVYLFNKFYPDDILIKLTDICNSFSFDSTDWLTAEWTNNRYIFKIRTKVIF